MKITYIPGYKDLYGDIPADYDHVVAKLPSEVLIIAAASLNDELNERMNDENVQFTILSRLTARFPPHLQMDLQRRIKSYQARSNYLSQVILFERIVFLELISHEVKRNIQFELTDISPEQELNILWAYLLTVDRLHQRNSASFKKAIDAPIDEHTLYREVWVPLLYQYQYNEYPYPPYLYYKLTSFLLYSLNHFRGYLREYLHARGMKSISELLNSFYEVNKAAVQFNRREFLPGLKYINPKPDVDTRHLDSMTINEQMGNEIGLGTIKRMPLYFRKDKGYIILDRGFYYKKIYLGPYFELHHETTLSITNFNSYSGTIAKEVLENICFKHILQALKRTLNTILQFDTDGHDYPDAYYRDGPIALLFELKAYIFRDDLPVNPDFDTLKAYLDSRFIANDEGKKKGIGQLCEKLELLAAGKAKFDPAVAIEGRKEKLTVYPIISFDDFNFTLPGVNDYLAKRMNSMLSDNAKKVLNIRPLVLVNLDILHRFAVGQRSFHHVIEMLDFYEKILKGRRHNYHRTKDRGHWLQSIIGLDEIFHNLFFDKISSDLQRPNMMVLLSRQNVTQQLLETAV